MEEIIKLLYRGHYSCVVRNGETIRTFSGRGVKDLHHLLHQDPELLQGALVADKVVGKAAASLMILGGVKELYTGLISTPAVKILNDNGVKVSFQVEVPVVMNRDKSDWCPLEKLCYHEHNPNYMLPIIDSFIEEMAGR